MKSAESIFIKHIFVKADLLQIVCVCNRSYSTQVLQQWKQFVHLCSDDLWMLVLRLLRPLLVTLDSLSCLPRSCCWIYGNSPNGPTDYLPNLHCKSVLYE